MHFAESVTSTQKRSHVIVAKRNKVEITTRVRICCRLEVSAKGEEEFAYMLCKSGEIVRRVFAPMVTNSTNQLLGCQHSWY